MFLRLTIQKNSQNLFSISGRTWGIARYYLPNLSEKEAIKELFIDIEKFLRRYFGYDSTNVQGKVDEIIKNLSLYLPLRTVTLSLSAGGKYYIEFVTPKGKGKYRPIDGILTK